MFFGKRRKEEARSAKADAQKAKGRPDPTASEPSETISTPADPSAVQLSPPLIVVTDIAQLELVSGRPTTGTVSNGWLQLGSKDGGRTVASCPAREGEVFVGTSTTVLIDPGANGLPSRFMFGPMFFDGEGKVLTWWQAYAKPSAGPKEISASAQAPAGTASVRLGVRGTYDSKGETGDYVVGFANARLAKVIG